MELQGKDNRNSNKNYRSSYYNTTTAPSPEWRATTSMPRG